MKYKHIYIIILCIAFGLAGCDDDREGRVVFPESTPDISNLLYSFENDVEAGDSIYFSLDINDPLTPLSVLEITLTFDEKEIYSETLRTKGNSAQIKDYSIYLPFYSLFEEGEATLTLSAVNVEGSTRTEVKTFTIKRPELPPVLYLHYDGNVVPMMQTDNNPFEYQTEDGSYPESFSGKISTKQVLEDSEIIWGYSETTNVADISSATGSEFSFRYENSIIEKVTFNTFSFSLGIIGISKTIVVNGITLTLDNGNYYSGSIRFTQGTAVEVSGIEDLEEAYNRDFFSYDATTEKITFLRETGTWEVYYSLKYNYMWMARMNDVAPDAFWIIGHGFTSAPVWSSDYNSGGWDLEDISRMAYAVKVADYKYQATVYLNDTHEWGGFDMQIFSRRDWVGADEMAIFSSSSLTGDSQNVIVAGSTNADVCGSAGFITGYYRLTLDITEGLGNSKLNFERLSY